MTYCSETDRLEGESMFLSGCSSDDDDAGELSSLLADPSSSLESLRKISIYYLISNLNQHY